MSRGKPRRAASVTPTGPRRAAPVETSTRPRRQLVPPQPNDKLIILMSQVDVGGRWCLTRIDKAHHAELLGKIRQWESMTVNELFYQGEEPGKDYPIDHLCPEAQARLAEIGFDDRDQISRLRPTGKQRLYGLREGQRFYVVWWDPEHEVCPSKKRNT